MSKTINFYKDRVALNFLAGSYENGKESLDACDGFGVVGVLSANYPSNEAAYEDMLKYQEILGNALSIGLGAGDPNQTYRVAYLSDKLHPQHANQVFTGVGLTRGVDQKETFINALVSPTGEVGYVNLATGPLSSKAKPTKVPVETAIEMIKDMGGNSIKFYPMKGLETLEEYKYVCEACAKQDFAMEPTGGIDLGNFETILKTALDAGVKKVIPHIYSSIIDKETNQTRIDDVKVLFEITKGLLK